MEDAKLILEENHKRIEDENIKIKQQKRLLENKISRNIAITSRYNL
jgi:hypothetical protein